MVDLSIQEMMVELERMDRMFSALAQARKLAGSLNDLQARVAEQQTLLDRLQRERAAATEQAKKDAAQHQRELDALQAECRESREKVEREAADRIEAMEAEGKGRRDEIQKTVKSLLARAESLKADVNALTASRDQMQREVEAIEGQLRKAREAKEALLRA